MVLPDMTKKKPLLNQIGKDGIARLFFIAAVLFVFWPVTNNSFINFDDPGYITENFHVRTGITMDNVRWAFGATEKGNWHPLTWLSHMLDVQIFGLNPGGHHLINVFFHLANTLILFAVMKKMTGDFWQSALVAALFAFHPLHVESVAWASERKDVLSTLFWMVTLWCYAGYTRYPTPSRYMSVLVCFVLGLMAKPMLVTLLPYNVRCRR